MAHAIQVQDATVLTAGVAVLVVAEGEVHGALPALLRRIAHRREVARAERELGNGLGPGDAGDDVEQPPRFRAALDGLVLAVLYVPGDRVLHVAGNADAEHVAVDDDGAVGLVFHHSEGHLAPERGGSHLLARLLYRGLLERGPPFDSYRHVGAGRRVDPFPLLALKPGDRLLGVAYG